MKKIKMNSTASMHAEKLKQKQQDKELAQVIKHANPTASPEYMSSLMRTQHIIDMLKDNVTTMSDNATVITASDKYEKTSQYKTQVDIKDTNQKLYKGFFKPLLDYTPDVQGLKKLQAGSDLITDAINFNDMVYSYTKTTATQNLAQMQNVIEKVERDGRIIVHDTETLGGIDEYGRRRFDFMTEFYAAEYQRTATGDIVTNKEINGLIGLSNEYEKEYNEIINKYIQYGKLDSDREAVIIKRLGLYGHSDTKFGFDEAGDAVIEAFANPANDYKFTRQELTQGLHNLRKVWDDNNSADKMQASGLYRWQEKYADYLSMLQNGKVAVVDQNGGLADLPWNNVFAQSKHLNSKAFRDRAGIGEDGVIRIAEDNYIDTLSGMRHAYVGTNINDIYDTPAKQRMRKASGKGFNALENVAEAVLPENQLTKDLAPHTAKKDAIQVARLMFEKLKHGAFKGKTFMEHTMELAEQEGSKIRGTVRNNNQDLFFATSSLNTSPGSKGYLSFISDSLNGAMRLSGGANITDGDMKQDSWKQFPIRKNSFYTLDWAGEFEVNDKWRDEIAKNYPEFNRGSVFVARFNQVLDKNFSPADTKHSSASFLVAETQEELMAMISRMAKVGEDQNGKWVMPTGAEEEVRELLSLSQIRPDGKYTKLNHGGDIIEEAIHASTVIEANEKAARTAREYGVKNFDKYKAFQNMMAEVIGDKPTRKEVGEITKRLLSGEEIQVASEVAQGKAITIDTLMKTVGYTDYRTNKQELYSETLNKVLSSYDYYDSIMPIADEIMEQLGDVTDRGDKFAYAMNEYMNRMAVELKSNDPKIAYSNTEAMTMFTRDTNRFMVDVSNIYSQNKTSKHINNVLSIKEANEMAINLNDRSGSGLIKSLYAQTGIDSKKFSSGVNEQQSLKVLEQFVRGARKEKQYREILDGLKTETYQDPLMLARDIVGRFREAREANPTAGLSKREYIFDAINPHNIRKSKYATDKEFMKNTIGDILAKAPTTVSYNSKDVNAWANHAENLVSLKNKHLFKGMSYNGTEYKNVGAMTNAMKLGKLEQGHYSRMVNQVQNEYKDFMTDLLRGLGKVEGGKVVYDNENIKFIQNDLEYDLTRLPVISFEDGIFGAQIGGTKVAIHSVLDTSDAIDFKTGKLDPKKVNLSTNFKKAVGNVDIKHLEAYLERGGNAIDWLKSLERNIYTNFTAGSPGYSTSDLTEIEKSMHIRDDAMKGLLYKMKEQGLLNGLDERFVNLIKEDQDYTEYMNAEMGQLYQANRAKLWNILGKNNKNLKPVLGNISTQVKANAIGDYVKLGSMVINPLIQMQDFRRDVPGQERAIHMRRKDVEENIKALNIQNVGVGSYTATPASSTLRNRKLKGVVDTATELSMRNLNMSDPMLREMIYQAKQNHKYHEEKLALVGQDYYQKVLDKLTGLNLIEGNSILDPAVADAAFNYSDIQRVNMSKIQLSMDRDTNTYRQLERYNKLTPEFEIVDGKMQIKLNKGEKILRDDYIPTEGPNGIVSAKLANHDGTVNLGWFLENTDVELTESDINSIIGNARTEEEAISMLRKKGAAAYTTIKYDDVPDLIKTIQDGGEKNMTQIVRFGIGDLDERMANYAKSSGLKVGQVVDYRQVDQIFNLDNAKAAGFNSKEDFMDTFFKERYAAFNVLRETVQNNLGVNFSIMSANGNFSHENYGSILKHNFNAMVNAQKDLGKSQSEAINIVKQQLDNVNFFENMPVYESGGQLIMPDRLNEKVAPNVKLMQQVIDENKEYSHIGKALTYSSENGDIQAGSVSDITISQVKDYQNTTGREVGISFLESKEKTANDLRNKINTETDSKVKKALKNQLADLEEEINIVKQEIRNADKGRRISDRDMLMLNFDKMSQNWLNDLQDSTNDNKIFESMAADLLVKDGAEFLKENGRYKLKEELVGVAANQSLVEQRHKSYFLGNAGDNIITKKDLDIYKNSGVREGIERIVEQYGAIRKDLAEVGYSIHQGLRAGEFKEGTLSVDEMVDVFKFEKVSIDEFTPHMKNGYDELIDEKTAALGKNILLDLGDNFGDDSNPNRYVAMPYVPVKRIKDDTIRTEFEKKANKILIAKQNLDSWGTVGHKGSKDIEKLKADVTTAVDDYHNTLMFHMMGKEQMFGDYSSIRLHGSISTKTATAFSYIGEDGVDNPVFKLWGKRITDNNMNIDDINFTGLKDAQIDGMSLLEHAKQGRYFDAKWVDEEAFEKLGVFNEDFMKAYNATTREEMLEKLRTEGIDAEMTRSPNIKTGSSVRAKLYFSDQAKGNKAFVSAEGQVGMVGDNDGDFNISNLLLYKRKTENADGSIEVKDVTFDKELYNSGQMDADEVKFWNEAKRSMYYKAGVTNQHWRQKTYGTIAKEYDNTTKGSSLSFIVDSMNSGYIIPELSALDEGVEAAKQLATFKELEDMLKSNNFDLENSSIANLEEWLGENTGDRADEFRESFIFNMKYNKAENTGMSKMLRSAIGEVNVPMHKARQSLELSMMHNTIEDVKTSQVIQKAFEGIEQDIISYKKIKSLNEATSRIPSFEEAFYAMTSGVKEKVDAGRGNMADWLDTYAQDTLMDAAEQLQYNSEFSAWKGVDFKNKETEGYRRVYEEIKTMTLDGISSIDNKKLSAVQDASKLGTIVSAAQASKVDVSAIMSQMPEYTQSTFNSNLKDIIVNASPDGYEPERVEFKKEHFMKPKVFETMDDGLNSARQNDMNTVKSILEDTGSKIAHVADDLMQNLTKSKFGAGAMAFGAMFMFTGYMGGKPSEPAMDHATNMASQEQGPMLSDFGMQQQSMPRQTNNGYVINIKGKGSPVAVEQSLSQIQQTAHQSFSTDVNVSMNITQAPGNIDDRAIEQMISDAIG